MATGLALQAGTLEASDVAMVDGLGVLVYGASVTVAGSHRFGQVGLYGGAEVTHAGSSLQVAGALVEGGSTFHAAGGSTVTVDGLLALLDNSTVYGGSGGGGGGRVRIIAGSATIDGQVLAGGGNGWGWNETAGSGGGGRVDNYFAVSLGIHSLRRRDQT